MDATSAAAHSSLKEERVDNAQSMGNTPFAVLEKGIFEKILNIVYRDTGKWDHALVSKEWLGVACFAQTVLNVREDARLGEQVMLSTLTRFPNLTALHLHHRAMKALTDGFIGRLPGVCPHLQELWMAKQCFLRPCNISLVHLRDLFIGLPGLTELHLDSFDELPEELSQLQGMRRLELGSCSFLPFDVDSHTFPSVILQLSALERLEVLRWDLEDIPHDIILLEALRSLSLKCVNPLLPDSFAALFSQLTQLELEVSGGRRVQVGLPGWLGTFSCLQSLRLRARHLAVLPESLWALTQLEKLALECSATTLSPAIANLKRLKSFQFQVNTELLHLPASMTRLSGLTELCSYGAQSLCLDSTLTIFSRLRRVVLNLFSLDRGLPEGVDPEPQTFMPRPQFSTSWCLCGTVRPSSTESEPTVGITQSTQGPAHSCADDSDGSGPTGEGSASGMTHHGSGTCGRSDAQLSRLNSLEQLCLANTHALPNNIGVLCKLKVLYFQHCSFTTFPESLCSLQDLEDLTVSDSELCELPRKLGALRSLQKLSLTGLPRLLGLADSFTELTALKNLLLVDLSSVASFGRNLINLPSVQHLSVGRCPQVNIVEEVRAFPVSVQHLRLWDQKWEESESTALGDGDLMQRLVHLRSLELRALSGMSSLPESLGAKGSLEWISLMMIGDLTSIDCLTALTSLEELHLRRCESLRFISCGLLDLPRLVENSKGMLRGLMEEVP